MSRFTKTLAFLFTISVSLGSVAPETAVADNGWRWAKPLNQKPGSIFYSSNRNITHRQRTSNRYRAYRHPVQIQRPAVQVLPIQVSPAQPIYVQPIYPMAPRYIAPTAPPVVIPHRQFHRW